MNILQKLSLNQEHYLKNDDSGADSRAYLLNSHCKILCGTLNMTEGNIAMIRMAGLDGVDACGVTRMSSNRSPLSVYVEKKNIIRADYSSCRVRWPRLLDQIVRREFKQDFIERENREIDVYDNFFIYQSSLYPFMISSLDGVVYDRQTQQMGGLEIKAIVNEGGKKDEDINEDYCAAQHHMAVTGLDYLYVVHLTGKQLLWRYVPKNIEFINWLFSVEKYFWEHYIAGDTIPEPTGIEIDSEIINRLFPQHEAYLNVDLNNVESDIKNYDELSRIVKAGKEAEKKREQYAVRIKDALKTALHGKTVAYSVTWRRCEITDLDICRLIQENPLLYAKYSVKKSLNWLKIKINGNNTKVVA